MRQQPFRTRRRGSRGAAAVELALVMPILLLLVFGIINYGLVFNDSNNARQGAREAARRAVVQDFGSYCSGTTSAKIQCMVKSQVGALSGNAYVSVKALTWAKGQPLTVCVVITPNNMTKIVPMPKSVSALTTMSIEVDTPAVTAVSATDPLPSGISYPTGC